MTTVSFAHPVTLVALRQRLALKAVVEAFSSEASSAAACACPWANMAPIALAICVAAPSSRPLCPAPCTIVAITSLPASRAPDSQLPRARVETVVELCLMSAGSSIEAAALPLRTSITCVRNPTSKEVVSSARRRPLPPELALLLSLGLIASARDDAIWVE